MSDGVQSMTGAVKQVFWTWSNVWRKNFANRAGARRKAHFHKPRLRLHDLHSFDR